MTKENKDARRELEEYMNTTDREELIKMKTRSVEEIQKRIEAINELYNNGNSIERKVYKNSIELLEWVLIPDEEEDTEEKLPQPIKELTYNSSDHAHVNFLKAYMKLNQLVRAVNEMRKD